jgi:site-specific DNA recombinase
MNTAVSKILRCVELGSVKALAQDLERNGIRTKQRKLATGRSIGGGAFGVGALAYLLRNRFYIGEVVYRGQAFRGEHEPILDLELFAAVQAKLSAQAVQRRCRIRGPSALLAGRLFDEQGHRMVPTHTNKKGVRYCYYVSQPAPRKQPPGSIGRVPAPELETAVTHAIRRQLQGDGTNPKPIPETDHELIEQHLVRARLSTKDIILHLRADVGGNDPAAGEDEIFAAETMVAFPWTLPAGPPAKGIAHVPAHNTPMKPGRRELLLIAIAKARRWIRDVARGHNLADIAHREGKPERYVRRIARLAFVSPRIITAIMDGTAPAGLTATALVGKLSYSWAEQEQSLCIRR